MNSFIEKNISALKKNHSKAWKCIEGSDDDASIDVVVSKKGESVPSITLEGKKLFIHSKFDPCREAERFISEINTEEHDLYIVMGFGFGFHIDELLKRIRTDAILLVIEKNPSLLKSALENRDLVPTLNDNRLILLADPHEDLISDALKGKITKRVTFITHRGSHQVAPEYYSNLLEICRSYLSAKDVNIATLAKFEKIWGSNIIRNINQFIDSPGANIFYERFKDVPAIIVAAGPSLTESIDFIREHCRDTVIVAVDTAYKILQNSGINPHFCLAVDPQVINARYFEGTECNDTILVADPTVHPSVFRLFDGPVVTTGIAFEMLKWLERICGENGELTHGGSVSTNAYDFARRLGCSPLIMVGQDLAFTGGLAHARGSYLDEQIHLKTNRLKNVQMFNRYQLTALPKIIVRGIKSERVQTNQKMMIFHSWFEKRRNESLVNATFDGAMIKDVHHKSAEEIEIKSSKNNVSNLINEIYKGNCEDSGDSGEIRERLLNRINIMIRELDSLHPQLSRATAFSENLINLMNEKSRDQGKLDYILQKLSETDRAVESKKNIKDMISFTSQRVIHTVNEGYEIDESDFSLSDDQLVARKSHYLYKGLLEGNLFNRKIFGKMASILRDRD